MNTPLLLKYTCLGLLASVLFEGRTPAQDLAAGEQGIGIGDTVVSRATLLAIDNYSLPLKKNLGYYISKPNVRAEPVLTPSRDNPRATDSVAAHFYGTVLHDGGKFRMWYYGVHLKPGAKPTDADLETNKLREGPICYAESPDGLHWTKPNLGQVTFNGGSDNNALAIPGEQTEGAFVIRDESDPNRARRYKIVYENHPPHFQYMSVRTATSPDGLHWTPGVEQPISEGLEPSAFYQYNGLYYIGAHFAPVGVSEGGHKAGRQGFVWVSADFDHWLPAAGEAFLLPEPSDPNDRGLDRPGVQVHLGVGAASFGNVVVGLYCQWHAHPRTGDWFGRGTTYGDFGLLVSNDGQHFREPVPGYVFLNRADSAVHVGPDIRHEEVLVQSGNGILNVGNETWIYHGRWANTEKLGDYYGEIALATLPRDRWGALGLFPHADQGEVWSAPIILAEARNQISLNAEGVTGMKVEIADAKFGLLPAYSGENAGTTASSDGLDCIVRWPAGNLDTLKGKKVRLRIVLRKGGHPEPRLFAAYLSAP